MSTCTRRGRAQLLLLLGVGLWGCASGGASGPATGPAPSEPSFEGDPPAIHWVRTSAEYRAIFEQVYGLARTRVLASAAGRRPGEWAVILDADETVLDNSEYQHRRAALGLGFTPESWDEWVREEGAVALPGAVEFVDAVRTAGGRIAIVTNRNQSVCDPTLTNLIAVGVTPDVILCRPEDGGSKDIRFAAVQEGTTPAGLPPLEVVAWVGDNIQDFPGMTQAAWDAAAGEFAPFGHTYFVLPNPMYGSWERNEARGR